MANVFKSTCLNFENQVFEYAYFVKNSQKDILVIVDVDSIRPSKEEHLLLVVHLAFIEDIDLNEQVFRLSVTETHFKNSFTILDSLPTRQTQNVIDEKVVFTAFILKLVAKLTKYYRGKGKRHFWSGNNFIELICFVTSNYV